MIVEHDTLQEMHDYISTVPEFTPLNQVLSAMSDQFHITYEQASQVILDYNKTHSCGD